MRWLLRPVLAAGLAASAAVVVSTATPLSNTPTVEAAVTNPAIQDSCGTDVTLVLDASGSVQSSRAEGKVRDPARAFLELLADTGSTARLLQFATFTGELAARAEVTDASLDPGGAFADGLRGYYSPRPPRPPGVRGTSIQYTNWDGSLRTTRSDATQLVVYITDGDPTAYDRDGGNTPGDPFDDRLNARVTGSHASQEALDRAVVEADALKAGGSRILAVGVGDALDSSSSQNRLQAISGPQVVRDSDIGSIRATWVATPTSRNPILHGDIPPRTEPLPWFLTDQQASAFITAARQHPLPRYRLVAQVLACTGLRATEFCELDADAVTRIGNDGYWLRIPVGKLRNDRMIPLHADLVELFANWTATNADHMRRSGRLLADGHAPIDRRTVHRIIARIGQNAGIDDMHPHRLRHTLATQAINRGMRPEAIAALLGHRSLEMTLVYARITDRVVADEYAAVCEQIDALYNTANSPGALPAEIETNAMARLRHEAHARMLGNGMSTRLVELDCRMETICETCAYYDTAPEFVPVLLRQRDHARANQQPDRAALYDNLIQQAGTAS